VRSAIVAAVFLSVLGEATYSEGTSPMRFSIDSLAVRSGGKDIRYGDWSQVDIGQDLIKLPGRMVLVELDDDERVFDLSGSAIGAVPVGSVGISTASDCPTAEDPTIFEHIQSSAELSRLGAQPVCPIDEVSVDNQRYARAMVFPATVDNAGNVHFAESIQIRVGDRRVAARDLAEWTRPNHRIGHVGSAALSLGAADYLIVTAGTLTDQAKRMAEYRTNTGLVTIVESIDSITMRYSGRDDAERLRERLKDFYEDGGQFVLLAGDETVLPVRYVYHYNASTSPPLSDLQIGDLYFADLTGAWDVDDDGIWGEPYDDRPDLTPELFVGRLPFNRSEEMEAYVNKVIAYETNPGGSDREYLCRALFFSSDQMRDYGLRGQHGEIASAFADQFMVDTVTGVEQARGDDPLPFNPVGEELRDILAQGYGIVNIIAHGASNAFCLRTSQYNSSPKSFFQTDMETSTIAGDLLPVNRTGFYYSLACSNGGFDYDQPPFNIAAPNLAQTLLGMPKAGAIGFVGYSRWGWVGSSYLLQRAFFQALFADPGSPAVAAMYESKATYSYYRDLVYGQNFLGDPALRVYTDIPKQLHLECQYDQYGIDVKVSAGEAALDSCPVYFSINGTLLESGVTEADGHCRFTTEMATGESCTIAAVRAGYFIAIDTVVRSLSTDVEEEPGQVPTSFRLSQNFPNPFNPSTRIVFEVPHGTPVRLYVVDILGREVATLYEGSLAAGRHEVEWDGTDSNGSRVASGVYFYRMETDCAQSARKMVLLK
jgi:hypothetical protein